MNLISINQISKSFADKILFEDISFGIHSEQKIALIGINGCGKTTLLKILAKKENPDSGEISWNKDCKINFLPQLPQFEKNDTILNHIFKTDNPVVKLIKEYEYLCSNPENNNLYSKKLDTLILEMDKQNAWQFEAEIKSVLSELGITNLNLKMNELSGGMLKKVALAQSLIDTGNVLILDEPTNHLDINTTVWLENYLKKINKTVIMVTHDRYFLDNICDRIIELDRKTLFTYSGNYSFYLEKKSQQINELIKEDEKINNILRNELKWLKSGVKARTTKQKARIDRIKEMQKKEKYKETPNMHFGVENRRLGKTILEIKNITKSFDDNTIIKPFNYVFKSGEKLGIIGPNGAGKTTFLKLISGKLNPDSGEIIKGINTEIAVFDQLGATLDPEKRIIDTIKEFGENIRIDNGKYLSAGQLLEKFLFPSSVHSIPVKKLSGGEKRRLQLISILIKNPNFLIFDEPTNDLDIKTLSILEDFLCDFKGCLIVVSHDRYFMNRVTDHLLVFDGNGNINEFPGNFTDYLNSTKENEIVKQPVKEYNKPKIKKQPKKLSYKEKIEFENIENEIDELESLKTEIEKQLSENTTDYEKLSELQNKLEEIEKEILIKMERWEYLTNKAENQL